MSAEKEKEASGKARTIDLVRDEKAEKTDGKSDATQAKSSAAPPSSRLKAPPKVDAPPSRGSAREAPSSASAKGKERKMESDRGLADDALTKVAQEKFEAQEEKLKDIARHAMSSLRDFQKLSESDFAKKVIEIRKALMKYEMQYVRVWELQARTRGIESDESHATAERLHSEAEAEVEVSEMLATQLQKEKQRKRRYETHEAAATEINKKRTRTELQAEIDAKNSDIEQLRRQKQDLKEQGEQLHQRGQLLREAAADMKQLLATQMESSGGAPGAQAGSSARKGGAPATLVEVIS